MNTGPLKTSLAMASVVLLGACAGAREFGFPWVQQGPGISAEEARARSGERPAAAAPARPVAAAAQAAPAAAPPTSGWGAPLAPAAAATAPATSPAAAPRQVAAVETARPAAAAAAPAATMPGYPQASRYGDLLFISGQIPMDLKTRNVNAEAPAEDQARLALDNVRAVLESNNLTMANVVSTTVYLKNINDLRYVDMAYASTFKGNLPARTVVEVARLPRGVLLEISAIAGR